MNTQVFGKYSSYYDLLYKDKDYASEADFVQSLIQKYSPECKTLLDLGCGTGSHAFILAQNGFYVTGVDISKKMISIAKRFINSRRLLNPHYVVGDIRNIRLKKQFDVVISLFHVMSYQTSNKDIQAAFSTAYAHLNPGGIFIFDGWYGTGVLTDPPKVSVKRMENEKLKVIRIAEPELHPNENIVDVNYTLVISHKNTNKIEEIKETHRMRYLFKPEIELLFTYTGFKFICCAEWITGKNPLAHTWNVYFIGKKNGESGK